MGKRSWLFGVAAALALGCGSTAHAQAIDHGHSELELEFERASAPPPRDVLALTGFALFAFAYGDSIVVALLSDRSSDKKLYIPVAGPWLDLAKRDCAAQHCSAEWLSATLLVADGVTQGAGVALMVASLFVPDQRTDVRVGSVRVRIGPARFAPGSYGLQAVGRF